MAGAGFRHKGRFALVTNGSQTKVVFEGPMPLGAPKFDPKVILQDGKKRFILKNVTIGEVMGQMTFSSNEPVIYEDVIEA